MQIIPASRRWGNIPGTLSDQTDLWAALGAGSTWASLAGKPDKYVGTGLDYATLQAAITHYLTDTTWVVLHITEPQTIVSGDCVGGILTIPQNVCLHVHPGAIITISDGLTLVINGAIRDCEYQIFASNIPGTVYKLPGSYTGTFQIGESVTQATSNAVALVAYHDTVNGVLYLRMNPRGVLDGTHTISSTGSFSAATGTPTSITSYYAPVKFWKKNLPYARPEWFGANLNPGSESLSDMTVNALALNQVMGAWLQTSNDRAGCVLCKGSYWTYGTVYMPANVYLMGLNPTQGENTGGRISQQYSWSHCVEVVAPGASYGGGIKDVALSTMGPATQGQYDMGYTNRAYLIGQAVYPSAGMNPYGGPRYSSQLGWMALTAGTTSVEPTWPSSATAKCWDVFHDTTNSMWWMCIQLPPNAIYGDNNNARSFDIDHTFCMYVDYPNGVGIFFPQYQRTQGTSGGFHMGHVRNNRFLNCATPMAGIYYDCRIVGNELTAKSAHVGSSLGEKMWAAGDTVSQGTILQTSVMANWDTPSNTKQRYRFMVISAGASQTMSVTEPTWSYNSGAVVTDLSGVKFMCIIAPAGLWFHGSNTRVTDNILYGGSHGLVVDGAVNDTTFIGNHVDDVGAYGMMIDGSPAKFVIVGNKFSGATYAGLYAYGATTSIITNNTFDGNGYGVTSTYGLSFVSCQEISAMHNIFVYSGSSKPIYTSHNAGQCTNQYNYIENNQGVDIGYINTQSFPLAVGIVDPSISKRWRFVNTSAKTIAAFDCQTIGKEIVVYVRDLNTTISGWNGYSGTMSNRTLTATTGGTVFADVSSATVFDYFPDTAVVNDAIYFGSLYPFGGIQITVDAGAVNARTDTLVWEYYNGSTWATLPNVVNPTAFKSAGAQKVFFDPQFDWASTTLSGYNIYWIRCRISVSGGDAEGGANVTNTSQFNFIRLAGDVAIGGATPGNIKLICQNRVWFEMYRW